MPSEYEETFRRNENEAADCVVLALAAVTGHSYMDAHKALAIVGRSKAEGTAHDKTRDALRALGYEVAKVWTKVQIGLETRTSKPTLADLEGKDWLPRMIVHVNKFDHVAPFWSGKVRDWSANTEALIDEAWEVRKIGLPIRSRTPPVIYL